MKQPLKKRVMIGSDFEKRFQIDTRITDLEVKGEVEIKQRNEKNLWLKNISFHEPVKTTQRIVFGKSITFEGVVFNKTVDLTNSGYEAQLHFLDCEFMEELILDDCRFLARVTHPRSCFSFNNVTVFGAMRIENATFAGSVVFSNTDFKDKIECSDSNFKNWISLANVSFQWSPDIEKVAFEKAINVGENVSIEAKSHNDQYFFRKLKRLAEENKNSQAKYQFHAHEMNAIRWARWKDIQRVKLCRKIYQSMRLFFSANQWYWLLSFYGQSIKRPLLTLISSLLVASSLLNIFNGVSVNVSKNQTLGGLATDIEKSGILKELLFLLSPVIRPFYKIDFLLPTSGWSLVLLIVNSILIGLCLGFMVIAVRRQFKD